MSDDAATSLRELTANDKICQDLKNIILSGWPEQQCNIKSTLHQFWNYRDELSYVDGIIFKSEKVFVPESMRTRVLADIHKGHFGLNKSLSRARESVFWPKMCIDISEIISKCATCQVHQPCKQKEPLINKEIPTLPFEIVAIDLFYFKNSDYIALTDSYSGLLNISKLKETTSKEIINFLRSIFAMHGIPRIVESDNGPQLVSSEFKKFAKEWKFNHKTSSPYHPSGNGLAERGVQIAKNILKKCAHDGSDELMALLNYHNSPRGDLGSPAQRIYSRRLRTLLPVKSKSLEPCVYSNVTRNLTNKREQQKYFADTNRKEAQQMKIGDNVLYQFGPRNWKPAKVIEVLNPRSIVIRDPRGKVYRRNSIHLRKTEADIPNDFSAVSIPSNTNIEINDNQHNSTIENNTTIPQSSSSIIQNQSSQNPSNETQYRTRSGRLVKRPNRLSL